MQPDPSQVHYSKCPEGHALPHHTPGFAPCNPLECGNPDDKPAKQVKPPKAIELTPEQKLNRADKEDAAMAKRLGVPQNLAGADAEEWADKEIINLLPKAVQHLKKMLKYGTEAEKERAMQRVLDATGRGKREAMTGGAAPIIILQGGQVMTPPWKQAAPAAQVVDGSVVKKDGK